MNFRWSKISISLFPKIFMDVCLDLYYGVLGPDGKMIHIQGLTRLGAGEPLFCQFFCT